MLALTAAEGLFYLFAFGMVAFASLVISTERSIHSIFYFIATFLNAAGLTLLLGAEFLSFVMVIVYVGAVAVLFLFVVMMINLPHEHTHGWKKPIMFMVGILGVEGALLGNIMYFMPWRALPKMPTTSNIHDLGRLLYTEYFLAFQLIGIVLFTAVVGVVVLTIRQRRHIHRQNINMQLKRIPSNTLELKDIDLGSGI